ncbi:heme-binding domain-containing protein [Aquimarina sp. 2201CG14-23]|uniref:heme-binding domain-containing protein n=1 Tax=Aquimarina mycalae TaxID=3040073 RepID=UPI0024780943|nr:heme-binding domain-containing protein [Aquimarina sp. 2201CG14-23]MDH7444078.1 heme-binding domain-containing protein [Aquimarina sp. 2201CG14-23]
MIKKIGISLIVLLVIAQFFRPDKNESGYETVVAFESETSPSPEIKAMLRANCYDCHSAQTQYPWYAAITPVSYWLADHIEHGKGHFDVSVWDTYTNKKKDHKLEELIEMVEDKTMPLDSYTWIHGDLSEEDAQKLIDWAKKVRSTLK